MALLSTSIDALPTECLAHVLSHLALRDAVAAMCASKRFLNAAALPVAWISRLSRVFDLQLQTTGRGPVDWPALYRSVEKGASLGAVRFQAAFTDGGMDEGEMRYWADNIFAANHWESHCTALGANVHIIGLLLGGPVLTDEEEQAHRAFMIERLRIPAQVVFDSGAAGMMMPNGGRTRLEAWSTSELEHFLQMLHQQMDMGMGLGRLLLAGVSEWHMPFTVAKLRQVCERLGVRHSERAADMVTAPGQPHAMLDSRLLPLLRTPPMPDDNCVASVERVSVSRAGHFSCPLRTGLLLLGDWRRGLGAAPDGSVRGDGPTVLARMQAIAADTACRAFDGITDKAGLVALEQSAAAGQLPQPVAWGTTKAGEWVEFDRDWQPPPGSSGVQPVAWFRFFDVSESGRAGLCLFNSGKAFHCMQLRSYTDLTAPGAYMSRNLKVPQQTAGAANASGSPAATAAHPQPAAMSQSAEADAAGAPAAEAAAGAGSAGGAAEAAPMSQLPDAEEAADSVADTLGVNPTADSTAQELLDIHRDASDGFHLEEFEDTQLEPQDGSESDGDEDMLAAELAAAGGVAGQEGAAPAALAAADAAGNGLAAAEAAAAHVAARAAARSTDGRSMLEIRLLKRHAGSLAVVKLIDSENMMSAWHDEHEQPNIDVACVVLRGRSICLPDTVRYAG